MITANPAIVTFAAIDKPATNKANPGQEPKFTIQLAVDKTTAAQLYEMAAATGNPVPTTLFVPNGAKGKPNPNVPDDAVLVRFTSKFRPIVVNEHAQEVADLAVIARDVQPGALVRVDTKAVPYNHPLTGKGVLLSLDGVMLLQAGKAVGGGEWGRSSITQVAAPAANVPPSAPANPFGAAPAAPAAAVAPAVAATGNPFAVAA